MTVVYYDKVKRRLWICGKRIHHGLAGAAMTAAGVLLMVHDLKDAPWLRDNDD